MRIRKLLASLVVAGLCLVPGVPNAEAQGEDDAPPAQETGPANTDVKPTRADASRSAERAARAGDIDATKVSTEDKAKNAETMIAESRGALARATALLAEARNAKDVVQRNCVNEKLTQIKGLLRLSERASVSMYDAIGSGTQDVTNHEYTKIAVAHQKTQLLRAEAEQCVGELSVYTGDTEVEVEIDGDIPTTDPTNPIAPPPGPETPPVASAF